MQTGCRPPLALLEAQICYGLQASEVAHVKPRRGLRLIMLTSVSSLPLELLPFFSFATCTATACCAGDETAEVMTGLLKCCRHLLGLAARVLPPCSTPCA